MTLSPLDWSRRANLDTHLLWAGLSHEYEIQTVLCGSFWNLLGFCIRRLRAAVDRVPLFRATGAEPYVQSNFRRFATSLTCCRCCPSVVFSFVFALDHWMLSSLARSTASFSVLR